MHGDFSRLALNPSRNERGVLHQQGRVSLDRDGTDQARLSAHWLDELGRAALGAGVVAVPAHLPDSLRVESASVAGDAVTVNVLPGQVWVDGLVVVQPGVEGTSVERGATYVREPGGPRNVVLLEAWYEAVSAFQDPAFLLEPALGGPDTTERMRTATAVRLGQMELDETCETAAARLADNLATHGTLTVALQPPEATGGDCPEVSAGGYTGFEHALYRVEIAATDAGAASMKISRFNGGLVGRATYMADEPPRFVLSANREAILRSRLTRFYLEVVKDDGGHSRPIFGQTVFLNGDQDLELQGDPILAGTLEGGEEYFIRLWDEIRDLSDFTAEGGTPLRDGILLRFSGSEGFTPGDYWTFPLRAGGINNPETLLAEAPPEGPVRHRAALAVLTWADSAATVVTDCRRPFQPLTRQTGCCTVRVGDGIHSHGDVTSIQAAINRLPPEGGTVCVLTGVYREAVSIEGRRNIVLHGCGIFSRLEPGSADPVIPAAPVVTVRGSQGIRITDLFVAASGSSHGILVERVDAGPDDWDILPLRDIEIERLKMTAALAPAIELRGGEHMRIERCRIAMADVQGEWTAVVSSGTDVLIHDNRIEVEPGKPVNADNKPLPNRVHAGLGGIWLRGGSTRVRVERNDILGGIGTGIILGHIETEESNGDLIPGDVGWIQGLGNPCAPCLPGDFLIPDGPDPDRRDPNRRPSYVPGPPLKDIVIAGNRIEGMGLAGIGVVGFFLRDIGQIHVEALEIAGNRIVDCLKRGIRPINVKRLRRMGYGAIGIAHASNLTIWDNHIERNGLSPQYATCGIYVLYGDGVEVARNHILENGGRADSGPQHAGPRAAIWIELAKAPTIQRQEAVPTTSLVRLPASVPAPALALTAVRVHDNVVAQPIGQALVVNALGAVSVQGNQLVSEGEGPNAIARFGSAVRINNLGRSHDAPGLSRAARPETIQRWRARWEAVVDTLPGGEEVVKGLRAIWVAALDLPAMWKHLAHVLNGNILFSGNQVVMDTSGPGATPLFSTAVTTLDDLGFSNNQCDALSRAQGMLSQVLAVGFTLRLVGNRLTEIPARALFSAVTVAQFNTTSTNHSTHCLHIAGTVVHNPGNIQLMGILSPYRCGQVTTNIERRFASASRVRAASAPEPNR